MFMGKTTFEWDDEKDKENQANHHVSFVTAQQAFLDPVLSQKTCFTAPKRRGTTVSDVLATTSWRWGLRTVATWFASLAQDTGGKEKKLMKNKARYTDEPMGELKVVKDFLPPPDQLVLKEDNVKVTLSLKRSSIDFFKQEAKKHRTYYQKMIREVVDWYASHYQKSA
jgi:hypothetical protein